MMFNKFIRFAKLFTVITTVSIMALACKKEGADDSLELSVEEIKMISLASQSSFNITSNGNWNISSSEEWCDATPASGNGNALIVVKTTSDNTALEPRMANLTVTCGSISKTIQVTQAAYSKLQLSEGRAKATYDQKSVSVSLTASDNWKIVESTLPSWMTTKTMTGAGGTSEIVFDLTQNDTEANRTASVKIALATGTEEVTFEVIQYTVRGDGRMSDSLALVEILSCIDQPVNDKRQFDFSKPMSSWNCITLREVEGEMRVVVLNISSAATYVVPGTDTGELGSTPEYYSAWKANTPLPDAIGYLDKLVTFNCSSQAIPMSTISVVKALNITGEIPQSICNLKGLKRLYMYDNKFTGSIPANLGNMSLLNKLYLNNNMLEGDIPVSVGELSLVDSIDLSGNQLRITNIFSKLQNLVYLDLSKQGVYDEVTKEYKLGFDNIFPTSIVQLSKLNTLYIHDCSLSGSLPSDLWTTPKLWYFKAYNNKLSGNIPTTLPTDESSFMMAVLNLSNNNLTGPLPEELAKSQYLQFLGVSNNKLSGTIPAAFGKCTMLGALVLNDNAFTGELSEALFKPTYLSEIRLGNNQLEGIVPASISNSSKALSVLDLSNNKFTGVADGLFDRMTFLKALYLNNNNLTVMPSGLSSLASIVDLDLSNNNITGTIPAFFGDYFDLEYLSLMNNKLNGEIPAKLLTLPLDWTKICPQQSGFTFTNCPN